MTISNQACAALRCQHCSTAVYAVRKIAHAAAQRTIGFEPPTQAALGNTSADSSLGNANEEAAADPLRTPIRALAASASRSPSISSNGRSGSRERGDKEQGSPSSAAAAAASSALQPADGHILLLSGCIDEHAVSEAKSSPLYSSIYGICLAPEGDKSASLDEAVEGSLEEDAEEAGRGRSLMGRLHASKSSSASATTFPSTYSSGILPPTPQSLLSSAPPSPMASGNAALPGFPSSLSNRYRSPTRVSSSASTARTSVPATSGRHDNELVGQLEETALARLREARISADREVQAVIRKHADALLRMQNEAVKQGKVLLSASMPTAAKVQRFKQAPWVVGREKQPTAEAAISTSMLMQRTRSADEQSTASLTPPTRGARKISQSSSTTAGSTSSRAGESDDLDFSSNNNTSFQRRKPSLGGTNGTSIPSSSAGQTSVPNLSSSLSALSASFAMRGRELPQPPVITAEDWAAKKRLRERYPEGDHSAMNSEVNSVANSEENTDAEDEKEEEGERGRGRGRGRARSREDTRGRDRDVRPGELAEPSTATKDSDEASSSFAPGSLRVSGKTRPSVAEVSDATADLVSKQPKAMEGQRSSGEILLKPRGPPPSNAEPLKPATRRVQTENAKGAKDKSHRKSVAFAETTENVQMPVVEDDEAHDEESQSADRELLDESDSEWAQ